MHLSMISRSFCHQYPKAIFSLVQAIGCFPILHGRNNGQWRERNIKYCREGYHQRNWQSNWARNKPSPIPQILHSTDWASVGMDPYSPTILQNVLSLVLQIFLYLETFECNTTSDWLNHMVQPIRSCVIFKFTNLGEKDKVWWIQDQNTLFLKAKICAFIIINLVLHKSQYKHQTWMTKCQIFMILLNC